MGKKRKKIIFISRQVILEKLSSHLKKSKTGQQKLYMAIFYQSFHLQITCSKIFITVFKSFSFPGTQMFIDNLPSGKYGSISLIAF